MVTIHTLFFCLISCGNVVSIYQCPDAWLSFQGSCYFPGHQDLSFIEAERYCQHRHGHLVHINGVTENNFLKSYLADLKAPKHWIGLTDEDIEGVWQWYDTVTTTTFLNWGPGQPEQGKSANCGAIWASHQYNWVDESCHNQFRPLCERPGIVEPTSEVIG